mmetsp:Transcript_37533/g.106451  ORF Transcript_37533/g.106451 Transcript_37533/m.106451 type:complete len:275 (-) Transcript_37533:495-1319(-)
MLPKPTQRPEIWKSRSAAPAPEAPPRLRLPKAAPSVSARVAVARFRVRTFSSDAVNDAACSGAGNRSPAASLDQRGPALVDGQGVDRQEHQGYLPGDDRKARDLPHHSGHRVWHEDGRRGEFQEGRLRASWLAGLQGCDRGEEGNGLRCDSYLCAAACSRCSHHGGVGGRDPVNRLHHRGHPPAGHGEGQARPDAPEQEPPHRPELPRHHQAWRVQDGNHAGLHPHAGQDWHRQQVWHTYLRGGPPDYAGWPWADNLRRHRGRSVQRHQLYRLP